MSEHDATRLGVDPNASELAGPFGPGVRVALQQYAYEGGGVGLRELGVGEILAFPRIGERLEIRIRGERGLASSPVRQLRLLEGQRLAAATQGRVYVLNPLERTSVEPDPAALRSCVEAMLSAVTSSGEDPAEVTQYVRLDRSLVRPSASLFAGQPVRIQRVPAGEPDAKPELLGTGRLLAEPEPGLGLRFQDGNGHVVRSSTVLAVQLEGPEILEALTSNSCYRFTRLPNPES